MDITQLYVLLVEPSSTQQRIVRDWLQDFGIEHLSCVHTAGEALTQIQGKRPDLVVSAMHLADRTGTELLQDMRGLPGSEEIGFILISSETGFRYLEPLRQAGVTAILPKPFDQEQLKRALYSTLDYLEPGTLQLGHYTAEELNLLLVDDMQTGRRFMRHILERLGIEKIDEAANGREARELIDHNFYDLIISDYYMPEMDGQALVDYIRNQSSQPGVPVLMVSSRTDQNRIAALQQSGVSAVFDKPFDVETLRRMIETVLA
ncbi:MAG: two-component system response regulator [Gammaproteobacteria bacterium]|nr:two-component system response regulator [Gammaproteobacteria bacterium]